MPKIKCFHDKCKNETNLPLTTWDKVKTSFKVNGWLRVSVQMPGLDSYLLIVCPKHSNDATAWLVRSLDGYQADS